MDEIQEAAIVEANLEALSGERTPEEILQAITGYSEKAISIALYRNSGGGVQASTGTHVSAGEILAMRSSTDLVTLVDAPGPGKAILPVSATVQFTAGETTYSLVESNDRWFISPAAAWLDWSNPPWAVFRMTSILNFDGGNNDSFAANVANVQGGLDEGNGSPIADFENTPIVMASSSTTLAEGDGTLFVTVLYWTVSIA